LWIEAHALPKVVDVYVGTLEGSVGAWVDQSTHSSEMDGKGQCLKSAVEWEYVIENRAAHVCPIEGAHQVEGRDSEGEGKEKRGMSEGAGYILSKLYF